MRLANVDGRAAVVSANGHWIDVEEATKGAIPSDPMAALANLERLREIRVPDEAPTLRSEWLGPPVPRPQKILGVALNYFDHARESGLAIPDEPVFFSKLPSALCGPFDPISIPQGRMQVDWEAELVVVVGRRGRDVDVDEAWSYVAGVTAGQDVSDRQEQFRALRQFTMAKSFDTFAPTGPLLVTLDELPDIGNIAIRCWVAGELVQNGHTGDCIFTIPQLIACVSQISTLEPGDLIFTGTPAGVGYGRRPPRYLSVGDVLVTEVEGVGRLENVCIAGSPYIDHPW